MFVWLGPGKAMVVFGMKLNIPRPENSGPIGLAANNVLDPTDWPPELSRLGELHRGGGGPSIALQVSLYRNAILDMTVASSMRILSRSRRLIHVAQPSMAVHVSIAVEFTLRM